MKSTEKYVEPKAPGQTGDRIDSVRIARILNGMAVPLGTLIAAVGAAAAWMEQGGHDRPLRGEVGAGTCLILGLGLFLAAVGAVGLAALRKLSRGRRR